MSGALASHASANQLAQPCVLVADDDPASCRFLGDGLRSLGAHAVICTDGARALAQARMEHFDLLLLDCRMPGGGAREVLSALRADAEARSTDSLVVASSAELTPRDQQWLLDAGFDDVLVKPCELADLQRVLALLPGSSALLDDTAALAASGDTTTMQALRGLLLVELDQLLHELDALGSDHATLVERLHRLRSSCGFCGARALAMEARRLQRRVVSNQDIQTTALANFRIALQATRQALDH